MSRRFTSVILSSLLGAGMFVGAGVAGAAHAEPSVAEASSPSIDAAVDRFAMWADFSTWGVSLTDGRALPRQGAHGTFFLGATDVSGKQPGAFHVTNTADDGRVDGSAAYQISMLGEPTGFWIAPRLYTEFSAHGDCPIYQGDPAHGGTVTSSSLFTCTTELTQGFPNFRFAFQVGVKQ